MPKKAKYEKNHKNLGNIYKPKQINKSIVEKKKIDANKFVNNKTIKSSRNVNSSSNNNIKQLYNKKSNASSPKSGPIINHTQNNNIINKSSRNLESCNIRNYSTLNSFNQMVDLSNINLNINYEELGKNINEAFDSELKELDQDEANIELLLEQLNEFGSED